MTYKKVLLGAFSLAMLGGCLEVEDNNDQQIDIVIPENKVSIQGLVVDAYDYQAISSAQISILSGSTTYADKVSAANGEFLVADLPADSDIEVIISSDNEEFMTRVFYLNTGNSTSGTAHNDLGKFMVSEPHQVQISILDSQDSSPIENLEFVSYSHSGNGSTIDNYRHTSTYDAVNASYTLVIPKYLNTSALANVDLDRDGKADYKPESSGSYYSTNLFLDDLNQKDEVTLYLEEVIDPEVVEVEYRISVIDESTQSLLGADFYITSDKRDEVVSVYDSESEQYVINADFSGDLVIDMPSFSLDDAHYQSASFNISTNYTGDLDIRTSGTSSNCCYTIPNSNTVELVLVVRELTASSDLEVVAKTEEFSYGVTDFNVFYSQAVTVDTENVALTSIRGFTVTKGNDSADDLILPGVTSITRGLTIPTTISMSLNDTKLTVSPNSGLENGEQYTYMVGDLTVNTTSEVEDLYDDNASFTYIDEQQTFDINNVKLDNNNYTTNGLTITPLNTANEVTVVSDSNRSVYLYLPASINSLKNFTLRKSIVVEDNVQTSDNRHYVLVEDNDVRVYRVGVLTLADNETVLRDSLYTDVVLGTAQSDAQLLYRTGVSEYMSDNTSANVNSISFEYAYETKAGEVSTGTITLPVQ
ncbi:hypothetical protein [Thalassotalea sp. PLHSN55]|uniref:hypothetical protein n=1 Tax=Thalassotalea sp. PLHSN55 TaxID=3435888 RepID=UPI003F83131D